MLTRHDGWSRNIKSNISGCTLLSVEGSESRREPEKNPDRAISERRQTAVCGRGEGGGGGAQRAGGGISNPKALGSIPVAGQGERRFFCPPEATVVQTCLCLTPLSYARHSPKCVRTLKIPYLSVVKG